MIWPSFFFCCVLLLPEMYWYRSSWNVFSEGYRFHIFFNRNMFYAFICDLCSRSLNTRAADFDFLSVAAMLSTYCRHSCRLLLRLALMDLTVVRCLLYLSCDCFRKKWSWLTEREAMMRAYINKIIDMRQ